MIDVPGRRIVVRVPDSENLAYLNLTSLKLGPDGITTLSPDVKPGRINLVRPLEIDVTVHGRTERWTVYVEKVDFVVNTVSADAWSKVVWVYGESQEGLKQGFQYRQAGSEEWIDVPESSVVSDGTSFFCMHSPLGAAYGICCQGSGRRGFRKRNPCYDSVYGTNPQRLV